jgi:hypothetical protein
LNSGNLQGISLKDMVGPSESYITQPEDPEWAHEGYAEYGMLPPFTQAHMLDGERLTYLHHAMMVPGRPEVPVLERASHLISGAWCQIELAHVRDYQGQSAEASELLAMANYRMNACVEMVQRRYTQHEQYYDRLYRSKLLALYVGHYAELGPVRWPDEITDFQRSAYRKVQAGIVNPLLDEYSRLERDRSPSGRLGFSQVKGLLGEMVVLQCLNRLQAQQEYAEWAVAPASARENNKLQDGVGYEDASHAFDIKLTFNDQTFVPIEVKWMWWPGNGNYDPRVAMVYANAGAANAIRAARAMRYEIVGGRQATLTEYIDRYTRNVLAGVGEFERQGTGLYEGAGIEAAASELALDALATRIIER